MVSWRLTALAAGTLLVAAPARASTISCFGEMRGADCQSLEGFVWPEDSHPTVSALCTACPSPNDAGIGCVDFFPRRNGLTGNGLYLQVESRRYGSEYFEETSTMCGAERVYRYIGPLEPGRVHTVVYPGMNHWSSGNPNLPFTVQFRVAGEPRDPPPPALRDAAVDASADASTGGASADASTGDENPPRPPRPARRSGCSFVSGAPPATAPLLLLLCLLGVKARRSAR
jgi:hypothetical protein